MPAPAHRPLVIQQGAGMYRSIAKESTTAAAPVYAALDRISAVAKHLLVVDDEPAIRELFRAFLTTEGYQVDLAANVPDAWRMVQAKSFDCILLDLGLPGMGGEELYQLIEALDKQLAQRVIFVTGGAVTPGARASLLALENTVLSKPFELDVLREQVFNLLQAPG